MSRSKKPRRIGTILCLLPAVYFLVTAVYALINFDDFASDTPRLIRYVIGPLAVAATLTLCAFLLRKETALMVGITVSSIMASLFLFETYMTIGLLPTQGGLIGLVDDDVQISRFQQAMPPAYTIKALNHQLGVDQLNDAVLSGVPHELVLLCSRQGVPVTYQADSLGFRNSDDQIGLPVDVMILGDSFAEGICLPDGAHVADQIRAQIPSLINTAHRGSGPLFELAVLGRYGPEFQPKLTIMAFFEGNDWENLKREVNVGWLKPALDSGTDFGQPTWTAEQRSEVSEILEKWWDGSAISLAELFRRRAVLRNFFALHNTATILGLQYPKVMHENPAYERVLRRAKEIVSGWGGDIVVVYLPAKYRFSGLLNHDFVHDPLRKMVSGAASRTGIEFIDLIPVFQMQDDPKTLYAADSHFNTKGAALAANTILDHIGTKYSVSR
jgi:hypothetical protein